MKIDMRLDSANSLSGIHAAAHEAELVGYDAMWTRTGKHDPFLPLVAAAHHTETLELGTSIALAFAHNPMTLAYTANDLALYSKGRFTLGLGSQVKAHIERRYSMPWTDPVKRMAETIQAVRAIWKSWETGEPLAFNGEYFKHTLMPPAFSPGPNPFGNPRIALAAVGERMTEVAGELADLLLVHPFTSKAYVEAATLPALARGQSVRQKQAAIELSVPIMLATGENEESHELAIRATRKQIAFYGSTRSYSSVLAAHGWEELGKELHQLSISNHQFRWDQMTELINDEVLNTFAIVSEPQSAAQAIYDRAASFADRVSLYTCVSTDSSLLTRIAIELRNIDSKTDLSISETATEAKS